MIATESYLNQAQSTQQGDKVTQGMMKFKFDNTFLYYTTNMTKEAVGQ